MNPRRTNKSLQKLYENVYRKGETRFYSRMKKGRFRSSVNQEVLRELKWQGKNVLDVGCGTGELDMILAKRGARVTGIDYSREAIALARKKYKHPRLNFEIADFLKFDAPRRFDAIVTLGTLEHFEDPRLIIKKMLATLKPRGSLIITCPNWTNVRGHVLMTLYYLLNAPISKTDVQYFTVFDALELAKEFNCTIRWRTFDFDRGSGQEMLDDLKERIPKVFRDLNVKLLNLTEFLKYLNRVRQLDRHAKHTGGTALYHLKKQR